MKNETLHIVAFDVPYPPNYGGAIDVFFRLKALNDRGYKIILHCFEYKRPQQQELLKYCEKVYYYPRNLRFAHHLSLLPFSVISRKNKALLENLQKDTHPILFEGLISSYYINHPSLENRIKLFREANIEHHYYYHLALATKKLSNKLFYFIEAFKLKLFEKKLKHADIIYAISTTDEAYFKANYPNLKSLYIPCFHPNNEVTAKVGQSDYILYHGNLSVPENTKVATYLIENVFSKITERVVIAGLNPPENLQKLASKYQNIELKANVSQEEMADLLENTHIHILITFQATGMKIKLLHSLCSGRHIIVNDAMIQGSSLEDLCHIVDTEEDIINTIDKLVKTPFDETEIQKRQEKLFPAYSNQSLVNQMIVSMQSLESSISKTNDKN